MKDLASLKRGINLDQLSLYLRRKTLDRDKVWMVHGGLFSFSGSQAFSFMFDFSRSCSAPPPMNLSFHVDHQSDTSQTKTDIKLSRCDLHPIPVNEGFSVQCLQRCTHFFIHDMIGRQCLNGSFPADGYILCPNLKSGVYFVVLQMEGGNIETIRILKQ